MRCLVADLSMVPGPVQSWRRENILMRSRWAISTKMAWRTSWPRTTTITGWWFYWAN